MIEGGACRFLVLHRDSIEDRRTWSGIPHAMHAALQRNSGGAMRLDRLGYPRSLRARVENRLLGLFDEHSYYRPGSAREYATQVREDLEVVADDWDVLLCVDSFLTVACLDVDRPIIYASDCNKRQLIDLGYPGFDRFSRRALERLVRVEQWAYDRADRLVFSSEWAARSTIDLYGVPPEKVRVVPFGANLDQVPAAERANEIRAANDPDRCELLFLGVAWERKGGDFAIEIARALERRGLPTRLTVCGAVPPHGESERLRIVPFLDKNESEGRARLQELLLEASYMVLPTRAECSPIVLCESFAHGLPPVSTWVGGVPEIIEHGVNGFCLDLDASPEEYAALLFDHFRDRSAYLRMSAACRQRYEQTFNWDCWARRIVEIANGIDSRPCQNSRSTASSSASIDASPRAVRTVG